MQARRVATRLWDVLGTFAHTQHYHWCHARLSSQALAERIDDCRKDFEQAMAVSSDADSRLLCQLTLERHQFCSMCSRLSSFRTSLPTGWKGVLDSQAKQLADLDSRLAAMQKSSPKVSVTGSQYAHERLYPQSVLLFEESFSNGVHVGVRVLCQAASSSDGDS
eukprot:549211-Amphidinium_carterae.1